MDVGCVVRNHLLVRCAVNVYRHSSKRSKPGLIVDKAGMY